MLLIIIIITLNIHYFKIHLFKMLIEYITILRQSIKSNIQYIHRSRCNFVNDIQSIKLKFQYKKSTAPFTIPPNGRHSSYTENRTYTESKLSLTRRVE